MYDEHAFDLSGQSGTGKTVMTCNWIHQQTVENRQLSTFRIECSPDDPSKREKDITVRNLRNGLQTFCKTVELKVNSDDDIVEYMSNVFGAFVHSTLRHQKWLILLDDLALGIGDFDSFLRKLSELSEFLKSSEIRILITAQLKPDHNRSVQRLQTGDALSEKDAGKFMSEMAGDYYCPDLLPKIYSVIGGRLIALAVFAGEMRENEVSFITKKL